MTRSQTRTGLGRLRLLGLLPLSLIAQLVFAGPAAAAETIQGSGAGVGYSTINEQGQPEFPLCLQGRRGASYVINVAEGSVAAAETMPNSAAQYVGPLTVTITLTDSFFFGPAGIFADSTCTTPKLVPADISVSSPTGAASVSCADDGVFTRTNTTIEFNESGDGAAVDGTCTVDDGVTEVSVSPVTHAFAGNEYPCLSPPDMEDVTTCPEPVDTVHVQGEWTVTGADDTN